GHCFIHGGNAVEAILYLIFIASNLFQLFKQRRIKNTVTIQKELIRLLLKGLCLLKYDKDLIFSSG
ncbi:MAG: spermidine/putrescine ABC transporter substrate-binding protein, partial [Clostridiales bacterium]|nr:spermidine/putrescine ABC transporter substrate-binding protein [Clostridiales bacterium]